MPKSARRRKHADIEPQERQSQAERVIQTIDILAAGPVEPERLAEALNLSGRTLRRFMARLERAGLPVYTKRVPSQRHKMLWTLDVEKYLERFRK